MYKGLKLFHKKGDIMGHRLSKIYTRTGDGGTTGLGDGSRIDKDSLRIEAIGTVDELNSFIGAVLAHEVPQDIRDGLTRVQHQLFDLGGELCMPGHELIHERYVTELEQRLDALNAALPPLKDFILPGGSTASSSCQIARAVCRRAERRMTTLHREEALNPQLLRYLNRLSDLLFVVARVLTREALGHEILWQPGYREQTPK